MSFSNSDLKNIAFPAVIKSGRELFSRHPPDSLEYVGPDIIATFSHPQRCKAVVSRGESGTLQSTCTCDFFYGGACQHVIAAILAVNARGSVQTGLDLESIDTNAGESAPGRPSDPEFADPPIIDIQPHPRGRLYLREHDGVLIVEPRFAYCDGALEFSRRDRDRTRLLCGNDGATLRVKRSMVREGLLLKSVAECDLRQYNSASYTPVCPDEEWVASRLPGLARAGFEIFGRESLAAFRVHDSTPVLGISVSHNGGFLDCGIDMAVDGIPLSLRAVFEAAFSGDPYVRLSDGTAVNLPDEWLDRMRQVLALARRTDDDGGIRLPLSSAGLLDQLDCVARNSNWNELRSRIIPAFDGGNSPEPCPVPSAFRGTLRPYQRTGYEWFAWLRRAALGGCLADDMGLGKTVQTLAMLLHEKEKKKTPRVSLLIVPTTLLFNWLREAKKFAPSLLVMLYHGPERKRYGRGDMVLADVVLTTYGIIRRERDLFSAVQFNYVILDEAQVIKNPLSGAGKAVRELQMRHRLALSGTPLENSLTELWSLFAFLNPGMLGSYRSFSKKYAVPVQRDGNSRRASVLHRLIRPCILRRTKRQVAPELPPKTETVAWCLMSPRQQMLYEITRDTWRAKILERIDRDGMDGARMHILRGLTRLRQICCDPRLVDRAVREPSGKFRTLFESLDTIITRDHKVLIFSQFVSALLLLKDELAMRGITYEILTGKTVNRQRPVDAFQSDPRIRIMLISLKAGGAGLNLTAADYVFHLDPWWNPAAENQASDRAYRIGQTRPVFVYKLIMRNSVEQRVLQLQEHKQALFDAVIVPDESVVKKLRREDVAELFG